ncbi:cell wall elongation regulator TseB-like domain-containing protein [Trichococcus ilyis]|uniref:Uncharacterized protein YpmB n=1 Tax=Trichococcus ilyis TaxID=640938 RepID=A0A143YAD4_9LACT|nr:DUF5590 domain-containing protein [Trichococcus ilyis]CZQ82073.1 Hypothetical protein TR210_190 [Trichococcus ilyis]SEI51302.1 Uncharacterized protein YpmB [Trichococcus ilyis]
MKKNIIVGAIVILFLMIVGSYTIFYRSQQPIMQAQKEATAIAEENANIQKVQDFYWFNGSETYFTIAGIDDNNEELYVIIKKDGGETTILNTAEVITESEAKSITQADKSPERILEARLGMENEEPVWEVTYKNTNDTIGYYLISAISGKWLKDIENI